MCERLGLFCTGKVNHPGNLWFRGPDVKRIRSNFRLSQGEFAALLGISVATLRNWEQRRRTPEGPARILLQVAAFPAQCWK